MVKQSFSQILPGMVKLHLIKTNFDSNYIPDAKSRSTTNLVNLSKDSEKREVNISLFLRMVNTKLNKLLSEDNPGKNRYEIKIEILTVLIKFNDTNFEPFPISEILHASVLDSLTGDLLDGPYGFNLSSYIRDYDFDIILPKILNQEASSDEIETFGLLHGILYQMQFKDFAECGVLDFPTITAISISSNRTYKQTGNVHPVLGIEYSEVGDRSTTANYLKKMGMEVNYYMSEGMVAPLAYYHRKNDLENRSKLHLSILIAVMDTIQRIYRPEIYATNEPAGETFNPSLENDNFTRTLINYNRVERNQILISQQSNYVFENFLLPNKKQLDQLIEEYRH
jgi:Domain of unknown function (DUF1852)